jgi:hypothetical protein
MVSGRLAALRLALPAVALVAVLAGCDNVKQAQEAGRAAGEGVDKARQCAGIVADLSGIDLSPGSVARAAGKADEAARKLDERARNIDQTDVRNSAEALAETLKRLGNTATQSTPAERERAAREVTIAATRVAAACGVPLDQVIRTG